MNTPLLKYTITKFIPHNSEKFLDLYIGRHVQECLQQHCKNKKNYI